MKEVSIQERNKSLERAGPGRAGEVPGEELKGSRRAWGEEGAAQLSLTVLQGFGGPCPRGAGIWGSGYWGPHRDPSEISLDNAGTSPLSCSSWLSSICRGQASLSCPWKLILVPLVRKGHGSGSWTPGLELLSKGVSLRKPHPWFPTRALPKTSFCSHLSHGLGLLSSYDNGAREEELLNCECFYCLKKLRTKLNIIKLFCNNLKLFLQYKTKIKLSGINWNIDGFFCFKNWN